jgi:hypothetical protein
MTDPTSGEIDAALLARLVCPVTRTALRWDAIAQELVSEAAGIAFPVRNGVPVLVLRETRKLDNGV